MRKLKIKPAGLQDLQVSDGTDKEIPPTTSLLLTDLTNDPNCKEVANTAHVLRSLYS